MQRTEWGAMTDARLIAGTLRRAHELGADIHTMLARAMRPKVLVMVSDTSFSEERNAQARTAGFVFDRPTKTWRRTMAATDVATLPFRTRIVTTTEER